MEGSARFMLKFIPKLLVFLGCVFIFTLICSFISLFTLLKLNMSSAQSAPSMKQGTFKSSNDPAVFCFSVSLGLAVAELLLRSGLLTPSEEHYVVPPLLQCQLLWPSVISPMNSLLSWSDFTSTQQPLWAGCYSRLLKSLLVAQL